MGFLDNLLKRETRKIISGVVDSVVDNVMDDVKGSIRDNGKTSVTDRTAAYNAKDKSRKKEIDDEDDYGTDINVIHRRIEKIAAEDWPGYELRRDISASEFGASGRDHGFDYGLYLDGRPMVMIMILDHYQYRNQSVQNAHAACRRQGVGSFHLLNHLPNRKSYIAERVKAAMPQ